MLSLELLLNDLLREQLMPRRNFEKCSEVETTLSMSYIFCFYLHHFLFFKDVQMKISSALEGSCAPAYSSHKSWLSGEPVQMPNWVS